MTEKKEPEYIGRYGEVLEGVEFADNTPDHDGRLMLTGYGLDKAGVKSEVVFHISAKTGKKDGIYFITRKTENGKEEYTEESMYENGVLNGKESHHHYVRGPLNEHTVTFETSWVHGKNIEELKKREKTAKKSKDIREIFSDRSVKETVAKLIGARPESKEAEKALLALKSVMTRARIKKGISK